MAERSPMRYTVALQGFSNFERSALASFFRLAAERDPGYVQVDSLDDCDLVIADADQAQAVAAVHAAGRGGDTVFVGARLPAGAGAWLARPIEPTRIVRELDSLLERRSNAPPEEPLLLDANRPTRDALVVDDSRIALKFLQLRLQRLGFRVHLARTSQEALNKLASQNFSVVFLDVVLGADATPGSRVNGLSLCQHIKHQPQSDGSTPAVVMATARDSETDRVRGKLAGCDAYLVKPLLDEDIAKTLRSLGLAGR
jgi:two-component system cell cycle response regulator